ncbi:MAG: carboxylating nicotinate-nucleotide diphosphorylase [Bdellovibrionales bacterium]|nr:carboxylating nicotinate-nucleotide diphosphorylase [Bdellovibrionales bacterium]
MFTSDIIRLALSEDLGNGDKTTLAIVSPKARGRGLLRAKEDLVVCGMGLFGATFAYLDPNIKIEASIDDGQFVTKNTILAKVTGTLAALLGAERVALNLMQRLSGIATLTHAFVNLTNGTQTKILDTRKTIPLYRHLEKYAVKTGGGVNHRMGLYDEILIKDNHIAACDGSYETAVKKVRDAYPNKSITIEIPNSEILKRLLPLNIERFLLDNMSEEEIKKCVDIAKKKTILEVSGGVTKNNIATLCALGVDYISVGALTHSASAVDMNFKIELL